jgi:hypothetical protein
VPAAAPKQLSAKKRRGVKQVSAQKRRAAKSAIKPAAQVGVREVETTAPATPVGLPEAPSAAPIVAGESVKAEVANDEAPSQAGG